MDWPKRNILTKWYTGSFDDIVDTKKNYMHINTFEKILNEFPTAFNHVKPLCRMIQSVFFPLLKDKALFTKTLLDLPEKLYHSIIKAFKDIIERAKSRGKMVGRG